MDRNEKFLKKLSKKEFDLVYSALLQIESRELQNLDIKKLSGHKNIYRARLAEIRIIFLATEEKIEILEIGRRSEKTYKDF